MSKDNSDDNKPLQDEWDTARKVISDADEHLHDLRKYGFSFVTALLTAESFLLPYIPATLPNATNAPSTTNTTLLPPYIKSAVIGATLVLIVALQIMDRNYQVLQEASAKRALVLENTLNLNLTGVITLRFHQSRVNFYCLIIYILFIVGVGILGWSALTPFLLPQIIGEVFCGVAAVAVVVIHESYKLELPRGPGDWTISGLSFSPGDQIGITLFSLCPAVIGQEYEERLEGSIRFPPGQMMWEIRNEEDGKRLNYDSYKKASDKGFHLVSGDSHLWLYTFPPDTPEGVCEIWRAVPQPITKREAWNQLLFGKPTGLQGYFLEENKEPAERKIILEILSRHDLYSIIFAGEKIWKDFPLVPLPQDIIIKKIKKTDKQTI